MDATLPAGGFPPTPPHTSEEERTPNRRSNAPLSDTYPPVPMYTLGHSGLNQSLYNGELRPRYQHPQQLMYPGNTSFYGSTGDFKPSYTLPLNTPPIDRLSSSSPSWSPGSRNQNPASKSKVIKPRNGKSRGRKDGTAANCNFHLSGPLSVITRDMVEPPVRDMEAWVNRSHEERQHEVSAKNGEIPRPMNSFMLYRSAYISRIKTLLGKNCNQNVSRVAGLSWKAESKEIRAHFENLAVVERQNHAISHPGYKFKPNKAAATPPQRPGDFTPPRSSATPAASIREVSVDWDEKYRREGTPGLMYNRSEGYDIGYVPSSRETTPFGTPDSMLTTGYSGYLESAWSNATFPYNGLPMAGPHVEDLYFSQTSQIPEEASLTPSNNGLTGLPGATHELLQPQPTHVVPSHIVNGHLDPQLLSCPGEGHGLPIIPSPPTPPANPYHVWAEEGCFLPAAYSAVPSPVPFPTPLPTSAPMQREPSWDVKYQDHEGILGDTNGHGMDSWIGHSNSEY